MGYDILLRLIVSAIIALISLLYLRISQKNSKKIEKQRSFHTLAIIILSLAAWFFLESLVASLFLPSVHDVRPDAHLLFGAQVDNIVLTGTIATSIFLLLALVFRFLILPRFKVSPGNVQATLESTTDYFYKHSKAYKLADFTAEEKAKYDADQRKKLAKRLKLLIAIVMIVLAWLLLRYILTWIYGSEPGELHVEMFPPRVDLWGLSISSTIITSWKVIICILVVCALYRIFIVPRFNVVPRGWQNIIDFAIETVNRFTKENSHISSDALNCYILSLATYLIGCAAVEFFGVRSPSSDLAMTASIAIVTFVMINYYGFKEKGVKGRISSMATGSPIVLPIRIISDFALPVSLACRLFGNMVGGMIVVDLLYVALGTGAIGLPAVFGLYFNVFHPLIQAYIFVTLTLTFVSEAVE